MSFTITVSDQAVMAALDRLSGAVENLQPCLQALGEDMMERTKQRFVTSSGPDGQAWAPNAPATIAAYIASHGVGMRTKGGGLSRRAQVMASGKKPLIGESKDLSREFHVAATENSMTLSSSPAYAAIQQFGGRAGRGGKVTIPPRPFLPVTASGDLYPQERDLILDALARYIQGSVQE